MSTFGEYIRAKREGKNYGLREAARRLSICESQLRDIESGRSKPGPLLFNRLAQELGEDADVLRVRAGVIPDDVVQHLSAHPERLADVRAVLKR